MLPKKGRKLPMWEGALAGRQAYAGIIAELLRKEHGDSHRAVKQLMRQTDASERTVKHWLAAQHGPDAVFFLRLVATSPVIRAYVLGVIESPIASRQSVLFPQSESSHTSSFADLQRKEIGVGPKNDPRSDPKSDPLSDLRTGELNDRQQWFLERVARGGRTRSRDIAIRWQVSLKTARRDIDRLRSAGLLQFTGARKNGRYRLTGIPENEPR